MPASQRAPVEACQDADCAAGVSVTTDLSVAGQIGVSISGIAGLTNAATDLLRLDAEVPAGAIDPGEEPSETAWRELAEEALVTCDRSVLEPLGDFSTSPGRMDERGYVFLARNCRPDPTAIQHEPTLPVHLPLADAIALIGGEVLAATSALAFLLAQRRLAGGDR